MPDPPGVPRDEALKRFDDRYDALAASQQRVSKGHEMESGAGAGYRLIGELIGGVLTGLGLGWVVDRFAGTTPWGLIGGMLIGTGVAIFIVVRSAGRMSGAAATPAGSIPPVAPALDDQDDGSAR